MKRGRDATDIPAPRRQEPVSCQFCRVKKLRCSRDSPCSNCAARGIQCVPASSASPAANADPSKVPQPPSDQLSLQGLHSRISRIEKRIGLTPDHSSDNVGASFNDFSTFTSNWHDGGNQLSPFTRPSEKTKQPSTLVKNDKDGMNAVAQELTVILKPYLSKSPIDHSQSRIAISGLRPGVNSSQLLQLWPTGAETRLTNAQWLSLLPKYDRAVELLDFYADNVCWVYHFVHVPTIRNHLKETYHYLDQGLSPQPSVLALICSVLAVAKYFSQPDSTSKVATPLKEQDYLGFVSLMSQALVEARHVDNPTIESIQAVLLLASSLLINLGAMTAFRILLAAMFISAQTLLIHQVDSPKNERLREGTSYDRLELEIKRRIWWHIASSDWLFAFISGAQTEIYVVHSRRMHVKLPSNTDDAAISPDHCPDEPLAVPTEMSYFLFRCHLAIISREFMDAAAEEGLSLNEVEYEQVLAFDQRINAFTQSIPKFLRADHDGLHIEFDHQRPYLTWQRFTAQFGACTRMSGLHRPYIIRGAHDPKYAYSRMVCLRSARTILELEKTITEQMPRSTLDPRKIWAMMYQVFLATVVLVMDYVSNKDEPCRRERAEEIMDCCRRLEAAEEVSSVAARGLEELKHVMRKWGLLTDLREDSRDESDVVPDIEMPAVATDELRPSWTESWDFGVELDDPQWNALFQDLENRSAMF